MGVLLTVVGLSGAAGVTAGATGAWAALVASHSARRARRVVRRRRPQPPLPPVRSLGWTREDAARQAAAEARVFPPQAGRPMRRRVTPGDVLGPWERYPVRPGDPILPPDVARALHDEARRILGEP